MEVLGLIGILAGLSVALSLLFYGIRMATKDLARSIIGFKDGQGVGEEFDEYYSEKLAKTKPLKKAFIIFGILALFFVALAVLSYFVVQNISVWLFPTFMGLYIGCAIIFTVLIIIYTQKN